jgi:hypothetical protein
MDRIAITVDCSSDEEMEELAAFWAAALGYKRVLPDYLVDPEGVRPRFAFQVVPEAKVGKLRWHLDLYVDHLDEMEPRVAQLVKLGATEVLRVDEITSGYTNIFIAMLDPRGNEFCVCAPHTRVKGGAELEPNR